MTPQPPPGQGPIDPLGAFVPPPTPAEAAAAAAGPVPGYPPPHRPPSGPGPGGGGQWPPGWPPPAPPFSYPPPQPPRRGIGRFVLPLLLLLMLGGSVLLNLALIAGAAGGGADDPPVVTQTIGKGDPKQTIAVVELTGEINEASAARFDRLLDRVEADADVRALVVEVDSPGGTVTASDEIYARLLRYKAARTSGGKPAGVVVAMRSMATSGGYYVACAADHVVAEQTTMTGNIGVLMSRFNVSGLMSKWGVTETTIVSSGADYKNAGSPFSPETPEGQAYLKGIVDDAFGRFKQVVTAGRGPRLTGPPADVFSGKVFTAAEALRLGLIDQIGYPEDAHAHAATKVAGLTSPHVVRYREPAPGLLAVMFGGAPAAAGGTGGAGTAPRPGVSMPIDLRPETLDAWRTNRLLYR